MGRGDRFPNPHHIYAAELSPSEKYVFVWHMDFSPRRLKVYDTSTRDIVADFVPGVAGEFEWSADDRIIHLFGAGTGHFSCLYDVDGTEIRYGTEGRFQVGLHESAVPHVHPSRLAIVYVPCYELAPSQFILVRTSDGALLRLGPKRMIARQWDINEDRIAVTYSLTTDDAAPTHRGEYPIPDDWLRPPKR
ncbi:MAG: hypothetical protein WD066_09425 [Planctomycetaceae bacterium]